MYCTKCRMLTQGPRCTFCGSDSLREPATGDLCYLTQKPPIWAKAMEDLLEEEGIFYEKENLLGAALALSVGPLLEQVSFFVPYQHLERAREIDRCFFGGGAVLEPEATVLPAQSEIRFAQEEDVPAILGFIRALAAYEEMEDEVVATEELLREWLFERRAAEVLLALEDGVPVGFALFFGNFSTFLGRGGIYLEDLFVRPSYRGRGYGSALLRRLAKIAVERGCGRLEWSCLDWNRPSIDFYLSRGAQPMEDWTVYRLTGDRLLVMAQEG